jgi:hypothetical protein
MTRFNIGDSVQFKQRVGKGYETVIITDVSKQGRYEIGYIEGGRSFWWDECEFCTLEEATAERLKNG